jgi:enamine deaminase RidA (YjgF/YER057c/UK114 family)
MTPSQKLLELGITLPNAAAPVGSYIPAIQSGRHIYTSGQIPLRDGKLVYAGKVPADISMEDAAKASEVCALNALAAIARVAGSLDAVERIVRVCVYVASSPGFTAQPKVANGASDVLVKIFGDKGRHARSAVGVAELPLNAPVEIEVVAEVAS